MKKGVQDLLRWLVDHLQELKINWALVGGWALSIQIEPRFTRDLDLALTVADDHQSEQIIATLIANRFAIEALVEQDARARLATVRLSLPPDYQEGLLLDLLFASSGIEQEVCRDADTIMVFPGVEAPVAGKACLLALKLLSRNDQTRPQDAGDIRALLQNMDDAEIASTQHLLALITGRGYQRDKDLQEELSRALNEYRS
ncbi:MAG: nucleotidyl transferase AbiEii/AbiGii toxin family protein [Kiritimatiellia bacterium]